MDEERSRFGLPDPAMAEHLPTPASGWGVAVQARPEALPAGYGDMRYALACLETGHVSAVLQEAAQERAIGIGRRLQLQDRQRPVVVLELMPDQVPPVTQPTAWARRCSGLDPRGLSADPRPITAETWHRFWDRAPVIGPVNHRFALRSVTGMVDGVWQARPEGPRLLRSGSTMPSIARAFRAPAGVVDVAGLNVIWGIGADLCRHLGGDVDNYPDLLLRAGEAGQQVCRAAAEAGLFCRPVRGVEEPDVEAALAMPVSEDLLYVLLIGAPRVRGFSYDLTPATQPGPRR